MPTSDAAPPRPEAPAGVARLATMAPLLFGSGLCALIYQTVWMRQFRLLFGASTAATAATLAVFMGGLGLGGWLLGRRVERHPRPVALYGALEMAIGVLAAASTGFMMAARWLYLATGGSQAIGVHGATVVRLLLAVLVLGPVTVLMGATMPAAARAVTTVSDSGRSRVAVLLGVNTLGAVLGVILSTFVLLETLGSQDTLNAAAVLNVVIGLVALRLGRPRAAPAPAAADVAPEAEPVAATGPERAATSWAVVGLSAAVVGFAFMVMELVWYRMLGSILGGSTYTFGLILAVALLGIGLGGGLYAFVGRGRPTSLAALSLTCGL